MTRHHFNPGTTNTLHAPPSLVLILICVLAIVVSGCATKKIEKQSLVDETLPRPKQILIHDFAASADEVPQYTLRENPVDTNVTQTAEETAAGHDLGSKIAEGIVSRLQASGLPAVRVAAGAQPPPTYTNDIIIRGYLVSVRPGSATRRLVIGFGSGTSELKAAAEVFQVTPVGLRKLGSGAGQFGSRRGPGAGVGAASFAATGNPIGFIVSSGMRVHGEVSGSAAIQARAQTAAQEIAKILEQRAREHGWIN